MYDLLLPPGVNPIEDGLLRGHSRMGVGVGEERKAPPH